MVSCSTHGSGSRNSRKRIGWYGKRLVLFISQIKVITRRSIFPLIYGYIKLDRLGVRVGVDVFHLQLCRVVVVVPGCPCVLLQAGFAVARIVAQCGTEILLSYRFLCSVLYHCGELDAQRAAGLRNNEQRCACLAEVSLFVGSVGSHVGDVVESVCARSV